MNFEQEEQTITAVIQNKLTNGVNVFTVNPPVHANPLLKTIGMAFPL